MPTLELDHLVIGASSLEAGAPALAALTGVELEAGGRHDGFGTHNRLLSLGPRTYLELIAADPDQPPPARPRPFGLDEPEVIERMALRPRLLSYVVRTDDIAAARTALGLSAGRINIMRRSDLQWKISLPGRDDPPGTPILIEWGDNPNPSSTLPDRGLRLAGLSMGVPEAGARILAPLAADRRIRIEAADKVNLVAELETPAGAVKLD